MKANGNSTDLCLHQVVARHRYDFQSEEYWQLYSNSQKLAFHHPLWLQTFYDRIAPNRDAEPFIITGHTEHQQLVFLIPMTQRRRAGFRLLEAADLGVCDYTSPVVNEPLAGRLNFTDNLRTQITACLPQYDVLRIQNVRAEHVELWRRFFDLQFKPLDFSAHEAHLASNYSEWIEKALSPSFAKYLRRKKNRVMKKAKGSVALIEDPQEISSAIGELARLRSGRFDGDLIQKDFVREFYCQVAMEGFQCGYARTYKLLIGSEPAAYIFGITSNDVFHYLLIGCDYDRFGKFSPGIVIYDAIIRDWIENGGRVFDFTIGNEAFKADFGTKAVPIFGADLPSGPWGQLAISFKKMRSQISRKGR